MRGAGLERAAMVLAVGGLVPMWGAWASAQPRVTVNPNVRHQTVEGWGSLLRRADTATLTAWRDLGLNIMRMQIGKNALVASSTDWRIRVPLGPNLQENVAKFNMNAGSPGSFVDLPGYGANAQWLAANVWEPSRFKLIADSWSPPHWMKGPTGATQQWVGNPSWNSPSRPTPWLSNEYNHWVGGSYFHSYTGDSIGGRLRVEDPVVLQEFGRYFAAYVTAWQQRYGVPIHSISLQNESGFENPFDSMTFLSTASGGYDASQYATALKSVKDAFTAHGITTKVRGPHYANLREDPMNPWGLLHQMNMIDAVKNHPDPTLRDFLWAYTSNYYNDLTEGSVKNTAAYWRGRNNVPGPWTHWAPLGGVGADGKQNWFVETGDGPGTWLTGSGGTPGNGAITVALKMHNALVHGNASAYLYWEFVDGGSGPTEHSLLGSSQVSNPTSSKKYAAFGQFSRFVRPGAVRVDATFTGGVTSILGASEYDTLNSISVSAYLHDLDRTLTLVLLNLRNTPQSVTLDIPASLGMTQLAMHLSSETHNLAPMGTLQLLTSSGLTQSVTVTLPAYSVLTLSGRTFVVIPEPAGAAWTLAVAGVLLGMRWRSVGDAIACGPASPEPARSRLWCQLAVAA